MTGHTTLETLRILPKVTVLSCMIRLLCCQRRQMLPTEITGSLIHY